MAVDSLLVVSGTVSTEQDFITVMDNIMTQVFGWELVVKTTDTSTNRDYWWRSEGEVPGKYMHLYSSLQGTVDTVVIEGSTFTTGASVVSDTLSDATEGRVQWNSQRTFWAAGNKDVVYFFSRNATNQHYTGGFGYFSTYYTYPQDPYPAFIMGQNATTDTLYTDFRTRAYTMQSLAMAMGGGPAGGGFLGTVGSGGTGFYLCEDYSTVLQYNAPSLRDGLYSAFRPVFHRAESLSLFTNEVRGEMPYLWQIWGGSLNIGTTITASGILLESAEVSPSSNFIATSEFGQNDNTYIIGPVIDFNTTLKAVPYSVSNLFLYLDGNSGIERSGGSFHGGKVSTWRDFSSHPTTQAPNRNDAVQTTDARRPIPVDNDINGNSAISVASGTQQYMTGTVSTSNDMTLFAVAYCNSNTVRTPIINIRGNISAQDTLFSLEFNESTSNSVTAVNIAAGGTDRVQYTGINPHQYYILTNTVSGTTSNLYVNGSSDNSTNINNTKGTVGSTAAINYAVGVNLLSGGSVGSSYADGHIAEVIVYRKYLTNEERQTILCMLSEKYGITVSGTC